MEHVSTGEFHHGIVGMKTINTDDTDVLGRTFMRARAIGSRWKHFRNRFKQALNNFLTRIGRWSDGCAARVVREALAARENEDPEKQEESNDAQHHHYNIRERKHGGRDYACTRLPSLSK